MTDSMEAVPIKNRNEQRKVRFMKLEDQIRSNSNIICERLDRIEQAVKALTQVSIAIANKLEIKVETPEQAEVRRKLIETAELARKLGVSIDLEKET